MYPRWPELLEALFNHSAPDLRAFLQTWSEAERKACFKLHKADLNHLRKTCLYSEYSFLNRTGEAPLGWNNPLGASFPSVQKMGPQFQAQSHNLEAFIAAEKINFYGSQDMYFFALNLETAWAALCDSRSAQSLAKALSKAPKAPYNLLYDNQGEALSHAPEPCLLSLTQVLLERPESWADAALLKLFSDYDELYFDKSIYTSVCTALKARPDKEADFAEALGKAIFMELYHWRTELEAIPLAHILAGLSWRNRAQKGPLRGRAFLLNLSATPLGEWLVKALPPDQAQHASTRAFLFDLILQRMLENTRKEDNREWLKLYALLEPQPSEKTALHNHYLMLLQASTPNAISLSLQELKHNLQDFTDQAKSLPEMLAPHLSHPVQKVGKESFALLKLMAKRWPELQTEILATVLPQLTTPHAALRQDILNWLKGQTLPSNAECELALLRESDLLTPLELTALQALLPSDSRHEQTHTKQASSAQSLSMELTFRSCQDKLSDYFPTKKISQTATWKEDPLLDIPSDPDAMVAFLLGFNQHLPTEIDLEIFAQALLKHPQAPEPERLRRQLSPLLNCLKVLSDPEHNYFIETTRLLLAIMAHTWIEQAVLHLTPSQWESLNLIGPSAGQIVQSSLQAWKKCTPYRLEQPEYLSGWISLASFEQRLKTLPPELLSEPALYQALHRLSPKNPEHSWPQLKITCQNLPRQTTQLLTLALGPAQEAEALLSKFNQELHKKAPTDLLLNQSYVPVPSEDSLANHLFRGVMAAVGVRERGGRLSAAQREQVLALPWGGLRIHFGLEPLEIQSIEEKTEEISALQQSLLQLRHLKPQLKSLKEIEPAIQHILQAQLTGQAQWQALPNLNLEQVQNFEWIPQYWPQLWPTVIILNPQYKPFWNMPLNPHLHLYPKLGLYPAMAQDLFDAGLLKLRWIQGELGGLKRSEFSKLQMNYWKQTRDGDKNAQPPNPRLLIPELDKHDLILLLLQLGHLPRIKIAAALPNLIKLLACKYPEQRQIALDLIWMGLEKGRFQVNALLKNMAELLATQSKGLQYMLEALQNWELRGCAGVALNLALLEYFWAHAHPDSSAQIPAKNGSALLDLAYHLWQSYGPYRLSAEALKGLEKWAQHPKKSVGREKARALLDYFRNDV
jgi:hypothetical protein